MKRRSPYARSLEGRHYRNRIRESNKRDDFDDWVEESLEDYYNGTQDLDQGPYQGSSKETLNERTTRQSEGQRGREAGEMVESKRKEEQGES